MKKEKNDSIERIKSYQKKGKSDQHKGKKEEYDDKGEKPEDYTGVSFLYIRYNDTDNGDRPAIAPYWRSPDLNVLPNTTNDPSGYVTELFTGTPYTVECTVSNGGDLEVHSAVVEIFLTNATLGRRVGNTIPLGLTNTFVPANGTSKVNFDWIPTPEQSGHFCLLARAYSFSPTIDVPLDFDYLDTLNDRHVAQQNLTIIQVNRLLMFDVFPNGKEDEDKPFFILIQSAKDDTLEELKCNPRLKKINVMLGDPEAEFEIESVGQHDRVIQKVTHNNWEGSTKLSFIQMNLKIPQINVKKGEGHLYDVLLIDAKNKKSIIGGFSIIVTK